MATLSWTWRALFPFSVLFSVAFQPLPTVGLRGKLVTSHRSLSVSAGKSVYLQPEDFVVSPPGDAPCRIKVSADEPIWSRVGKVSPQIFNCRFKANSVSYEHSGSPFLAEDRFQLTVYYVDGEGFTQQETVAMTVSIVTAANRSLETITFASGVDYLTVGEVGGLSQPINASFLQFRYDYRNGSTCTVFHAGRGPFPTSGVLEGQGGTQRGDFFMDCREFLTEGLRYRHRGGSGGFPDVDYVPLTVEVEGGVGEGRHVTTLLRRESVFVRVRIAPGTGNLAPTVSVDGSRIIRVAQFAVRAIDADDISAADDSTAPSRLVFDDVTEAEHGYFVDLDRNSKRVRSFTQEQLVNRSIAYRPPAETILSEARQVAVDFVVSDDRFAPSPSARIRFLVVPSKAKGPRVACSGGLAVLEGARGRLTANELRVFAATANDSPHGVQVHVKGGLRHGVLEVNGSSGATVFTVADIERNAVTYRHDGSDTAEDTLIVRATDGKHGTRVKIQITVVPVDDNSPYLLTHGSVDVLAGGYVRVSDAVLNATDRDAKTDAARITYLLKSVPPSGEMVKRRSALTKGLPVTRFTQDEVNSGFIYYHSFGGGGEGGGGGGGEESRGSIEFRLADDSDPPNRSGKYTLVVRTKQVTDRPPSLADGATRVLAMNETDLRVIVGPSTLTYKDVESPGDDVTYTITSPPHFADEQLTADAGCLVLVDADGSEARALRSFRQTDLNEGRVMYVRPPSFRDSGFTDRSVRTTFAVSDAAGNSIIDQELDIVVLPVSRSNQVPRVSTGGSLRVEPGGSVRLTTDTVLVSDPDTPSSDLHLALEIGPKCGRLTNDGVKFDVNDSLTYDDLNTSDFRYVHDGGSELSTDSFELSVSDGVNRVMTSVSVDVIRHRPRPSTDPETRLEVDEGGLVFIGPENLALPVGTNGGAAEDLRLDFAVVKSPEFGEIRLAGVKTDRFSAADVLGSRVTYVHTGGEVGRRSVVDSAAFSSVDGTLIDVEVRVVAVDNAPPELVIGGPLVVIDGQPALVTPDTVAAFDVDSPPEAIQFVVVQTPMWGFLERSKSVSRSGRSQTSRRISSFTASDLAEGTIQYVPSSLSKGGPPPPPLDSFFVRATDGHNQSPPSQVEVVVLPPDAKLPDFRIGSDIRVDEGGERQIRIELGGGGGGGGREEDGDDDVALVLSVVSGPSHGQLLLRGSQEWRTYDVTRAEVESGWIQMVYRHDGSETTEDRFTLSLSDGTHSVKRTSVVDVVPVNDARPELVRNSTVRISVSPSLPTLVVNVPLTVVQGKRAAITAANLVVSSDHVTAADLTYILVEGPISGRLSVGPRQQRSFTQLDVDSGHVTYESADRDDHLTDYFLFNISVSGGGGAGGGGGAYLVNGTVQRDPVFFNILVQPILTRKSPKLIRNRVPERLAAIGNRNRFGFILSEEHLKAVGGGGGGHHPPLDPSDVTFLVRDAPVFGRLERTDTGLPIRKTFSQRDVNDGKVVFMLKEKPETTNDSFTFSVEEQNKNAGVSEVFRFHFRWAVLELAHNQYTVCEDTGSVSVKVIRRGLSTNRVSATVRAKSLSAKQGLDFIPTSDGTVAFDPGVTEQFWTIDILNDRVESESKEKFKVLLRNSNQAVIGRTDKAVVQLINVKNGRCAFDGAPLVIGDEDRSFKRRSGNILQRSEVSYHDDDDDEVFDDDVNDYEQFDLSGPYLDSTGNPKVKGSRGQRQSNARHVVINRKWLDDEEGDEKKNEEQEDVTTEVNSGGNKWRHGNRKNFQFNGLKNGNKKSKVQHPLRKYRKEGKSTGNRSNGKFRWPATVERSAKESGRRITTTSATPTTQRTAGGFVPQECTRDTKGLLYFDLLSSKMHRCTGLQWEPWGWGAGDQGYQYSSLLKDAAISENSNDDKDDDDDDSLKPSSPPPPPPRPSPTLRPSFKSRKSAKSRSGQSQTKSKNKNKNSCRQGWALYKNTCYRAWHDERTWNDAEVECRRHGAHLVTVQSRDHLQWLSRLVTDRNFWIGLNDKQSPGVWKYTSVGSGGAAIYTNWRPSHPRFHQRTGNCVLVRRKLDWVNKSCASAKAAFICGHDTVSLQRQPKRPPKSRGPAA